MKYPIAAVALFSIFCSTVVFAEKPEWVGQGTPPTEAQIEEHRDAMHNKTNKKQGEYKDHNEEHKKAMKEAHKSSDKRIEKSEKSIEEKKKMRDEAHGKMKDEQKKIKDMKPIESPKTKPEDL